MQHFYKMGASVLSITRSVLYKGHVSILVWILLCLELIFSTLYRIVACDPMSHHTTASRFITRPLYYVGIVDFTKTHFN